MEIEEKDIEDILMDDEDMGVEVEDVEVEGSDLLLSFLNTYLHARARPRYRRISMRARPPYKPSTVDDIVFEGSRVAGFNVKTRGLGLG